MRLLPLRFSKLSLMLMLACDGANDLPGSSAGTSGDTTGDTTGDTSGDTSGDTTGDTSGDTSGDSSGDSSGDGIGQNFPFTLSILPVPGLDATPFSDDFTTLSLSSGVFYRTHDTYPYQAWDYNGPAPSYSTVELDPDPLEGHGGRDIRSPLDNRLEVYAVADGIVCDVDSSSDGQVIVVHQGITAEPGTTIGGFEVGGETYAKPVEGILFTSYIHVSSPSIALGTTVRAGQEIGTRRKNDVYGENLHFEAFFLSSKRANLVEDGDGVLHCESTKSAPEDQDGYEDPEDDGNDKACRFPPIMMYRDHAGINFGHKAAIEEIRISDDPNCPVEVVSEILYPTERVDPEGVALEINQGGELTRAAGLFNLAIKGHREGFSPKTNDLSSGRAIGLPLPGEALADVADSVRIYPFPPDVDPSAQTEKTAYAFRYTFCVLEALAPGDYSARVISQDLSGNRSSDTSDFTIPPA